MVKALGLMQLKLEDPTVVFKMFQIARLMEVLYRFAAFEDVCFHFTYFSKWSHTE